MCSVLILLLGGSPKPGTSLRTLSITHKPTAEGRPLVRPSVNAKVKVKEKEKNRKEKRTKAKSKSQNVAEKGRFCSKAKPGQMPFHALPCGVVLENKMP